MTKAGIPIHAEPRFHDQEPEQGGGGESCGDQGSGDAPARSQEPVNKSKAIRDYLKVHPGAANSEVAAELTKQGIPVTSNFVATVKVKIKLRAASKAGVKKQDGAISKETTPASVNKSQAIRDYVKAHRSAANSEIVAELAKQGVEVTPNLVATVKAKKQKRRQVVKEVVEKRGVGIPEIKAAPLVSRSAATLPQLRKPWRQPKRSRR